MGNAIARLPKFSGGQGSGRAKQLTCFGRPLPRPPEELGNPGLTSRDVISRLLLVGCQNLTRKVLISR